MVSSRFFWIALFGLSALIGPSLSPLKAEENEGFVQFHPQSPALFQYNPDVSLGEFSYQLHGGNITLWNSKEGKYIRTLTAPADFKQAILELKAAGNLLLSLSDDGHVLSWDGLNGAYLRSLKVLREDQMVFLNKREDYFYQGVQQPIWANDTQTVAVVVPQRKLQLRDSHSGKFISQTISDLEEVNQTSLTDTGYFEWLEGGWVRVYALPDLALLQSFQPIPHGGNPAGALKGPYLALVQTHSAKPAIEVYDLRSQAKIFEWLMPSDKKYDYNLNWVSDQVLHIFDNNREQHDFWQIESGKKLGSRSDYPDCEQQSETLNGKIACFKDQQAQIYDLDHPENDQVWSFPGVDYADSFRSEFPAAYFMWLKQQSFSVRFFSTWTASPLDFQIPQGVSAWALNRDTFFMLDHENKLQRWDLKHNQRLPAWEMPLKQDIELKANQDWLLSTGIETEVQLYDLKTSRKTVIPLPPGEVSALAVNQAYLAVGLKSPSGAKIALWSRIQKRWKPALLADQTEVKALQFVDAQHVVSWGSEQTLKLWQVSQRQPLDQLVLFPETRVEFNAQGIQIHNEAQQRSRLVGLKQTTEKRWNFALTAKDLFALQNRDVPDQEPASPPPLKTMRVHSLNEDQGFWLDLQNHTLLVSEPNQVTLRDLKQPAQIKRVNPCHRQKQQPCVIIGAQSEKDYFWVLTDTVLYRDPLPGRGAVPDGGYYSDIQPQIHIYKMKDLTYLQSIQIPKFVSMYHNLDVLRKVDEPNQLYFYSFEEGQFLKIDLAQGKVKMGLPKHTGEMLSDPDQSRCHKRDRFQANYEYCVEGNPRMQNNPYFFKQFPGGYLLMIPNGYFMAEGPYQTQLYLTQGNKILNWQTYTEKFHRPEKIFAYFSGQIDPFELTIEGEK